MASSAGHGTDPAFGENTPAPLTDGTAFGWSSGGDRSGDDAFAGESTGWFGSDEPDSDDSGITFGRGNS